MTNEDQPILNKQAQRDGKAIAALVASDGLGHTAKLVELVESCCMDFEKLGLKPAAELYREELRKITCSLN